KFRPKTRRSRVRQGFSGLSYALRTSNSQRMFLCRSCEGCFLQTAAWRSDETGTTRGFSVEGALTMADAREVMNIRQASQYLGVSPDTLYKYVYEEKIPAFKLGNRWKFKKSKLDQWMEEKSTMRETRDKKKPRAARAAAGR